MTEYDTMSPNTILIIPQKNTYSDRKKQKNKQTWILTQPSLPRVAPLVPSLAGDREKSCNGKGLWWFISGS
jgi:hypothetical protein